DELVRRPGAPGLGKHVFFVRFQHGAPPDFLEIAVEVGFARHPLIRSRQPSSGHRSTVPKVKSRWSAHSRNATLWNFARSRDQISLMPAALITFAHFSREADDDHEQLAHATARGRLAALGVQIEQDARQ